MPVRNGEKVIKRAIDSLLSQTFSDFELIISDNASNDSTTQICEEYSKKDNRIKCIHQEKDIGAYGNFEFVLKKAGSVYFMWAPSDDIWEPSFLEKNVKILDEKKNVVGSISNVDFFGKNKLKYDGKDPTTENLRFRHVRPVEGSYEKKATFYLKLRSASTRYGVYRTKDLQQSFVPALLGWDICNILSVLRYGDIHVIDETLMHRDSGEQSSKGVISAWREQNISILEIIFRYPYTNWMIKQFGLKFVLKNLGSFLMIHYVGYGKMILDIKNRVKQFFIRN